MSVISTPDRVIEWDPTLSTAAMETGKQMMTDVESLGAVFNSRNGEAITIQSVEVFDKGERNASFDILLFNQDPALTSTADQEVAIPDANISRCVGRIRVTSSAYIDIGGQGHASIDDQHPMLKIGPASSGLNLYGLLVCRTSTTTYAASDLHIKIGFLRN